MAEVFLQSGRIIKVRSSETGADQAGTNGVDSNAVGSQLVGDGMQQPEQAGFAPPWRKLSVNDPQAALASSPDSRSVHGK